ncbi:hypothetical protein KR032_010680 [Drosophila birchii]|nr:hypothetical protein KR032_010680 [Drosophila birchii]
MKAIDNLKKQSQNIMDMAFTKLGSRSVYIERLLKTDWFTAEATCSEMGGHLITIQNEEEMSAITKHLHIKKDEHYWVGIISDLSCKGVFFPLVTSDNGPYFKWGPSAPGNLKGCEFCVDLYQSYMWDNDCAKQYYFICEH